MSNILVCRLGNGVVFILHILFAALQHDCMWKMRGLAYMCYPVGCTWHIIICKWKVYVPAGNKNRLLKGAWHVNGWYIWLEGAPLSDWMSNASSGLCIKLILRGSFKLHLGM